MKIPGYRMSAELMPCWWQPLLAQGYAISLHSDHLPAYVVEPGDASRFVADEVSEVVAEVAEQPPRPHAMNARIAIYPVYGTSHNLPLYRAITFTLLASGAKRRFKEDYEILLTFAPGSSFAEMEEILQRQQNLQILAPRKGARPRPWHRSLRVRRPEGRRPGIHVDLGIGIDPPSGQFVPCAAIYWGRALGDLRGKLAAQLANELAEAFLAAGAVKLDPVLPLPNRVKA